MPVDNFIKDLLFPKLCLGCQKEGSFLCQDCRSLLDIMETNYCLCEKGFPLPRGEAGKCRACQNKKLSGLYFALSYKDNPLVKKLVRQFKYEPYLKDLAPILASLLVEHFVKAKNNTDQIWENGVLVPVPLDIKKLKLRGYNQSELLTQELSKILQIPVAPNILLKTKPTASQAGLSGLEREKNLLGAFAVKNAPAVTQRKVFLVDDVYTTGSTMQECASLLRDAGAKSVFGIALARES